MEYQALAAAAYDPTQHVTGWQELSHYSSPDRRVFQRGDKIVVSFRGTNVHDFFEDSNAYQRHHTPGSYFKHGAKRLWESQAFRDLSTDALLAYGVNPTFLHRFHNATSITKTLVQKYGKNNVVAVGHSLGGSQALHVSNAVGVEAHAFKPHVTYTQALTGTEFRNAYIYHNLTDPVSLFAPFVRTKHTYTGYNVRQKEGLQQHSLLPSQTYHNSFGKALWSYARSPNIGLEQLKQRGRAEIQARYGQNPA